jgi:outer membrane protein assembly factor BamD
MMNHSNVRSGLRITAVLALLVLAAGACASKSGKIPAGSGQPDKFLFDRGTEALVKKKWMRAREYFRQLVDNYPQSPYRPDAKLGLGDTYLGENTTESVILAVNEYREYLTFYPTGKRNDYAQFKLGMAHYAQMLGPQRDQTQTKEAMKEFETFVERFPQSPLVEEGRRRLRDCRDRLSQSEYEVGLFYWRTRWYPGSIDRFKSLLKDDPEFTRRDAVYYYLADSLGRMRLQAQAIPYLDKLLKEFEKSEFLEKGKKLMAELQNPIEPPTKGEAKKEPAKEEPKKELRIEK